MSQDLIDHKSVENELAKRSHFCQKVIKKYKEQIKTLKADILEKENEGYQDQLPERRDENDLMNYLNSRITQYETKLKQT